MTDIRFTTAVLDDFNRANESPIAFPWAASSPGSANFQGASIKTTHILGSTNSNPAISGQSYLTTAGPFDGDMEVWGITIGAAAQADSWRMGLLDNASNASGYLFRASNPVGSDAWQIRRYDSGSFTALATVFHTLPGSGHMTLMQIVGANINVYDSTDSGANWTLIVSASDTTYRSGLYLTQGANGTTPGWSNIGGGKLKNRPQIYRIIRGQITVP